MAEHPTLPMRGSLYRSQVVGQTKKLKLCVSNVSGGVNPTLIAGNYVEIITNGTYNGKATFIHTGTGSYYMWYKTSATRWYISTVVGSTPGYDWIASNTTSATLPWDASWGDTDVDEGFC